MKQRVFQFQCQLLYIFTYYLNKNSLSTAVS